MKPLSKPSTARCLATLSLVVLAVAEGLLAGEEWRATQQPGLKQVLENAPLLRTESLGEPARGVNVWERWFVPNRDGKSWGATSISPVLNSYAEYVVLRLKHPSKRRNL